MYFDDLEYARRRLEGTLVRKDNGNPFFVEGVHLEAGKVMCTGIDYVNETIEIISLERINLTPVTLGFVNTSSDALYTCRKPMRRDWKQGLSPNSLQVYPVGFGRLTNLKVLKQPILNTYPDVSRAISMLTEKKKAVAFSRDFAFVKKEDKISLRYRIYDVGKYEDGRFILDPNKFFLEDHLNTSVR